ncbi:MAG: metallophosphoesterase [Spirochaetales bacterium]|nr:metallophosphoesterase [Spirochaetales bacterium]
MKFLCVSDDTDVLIYSPTSKERYKDVDCVLSAGDLPIRYYDYMTTILGKDLYYVYGNHNLEYFKQNMGHSGASDMINVGANGKINLENTSTNGGGTIIDGGCVYDKKNDLIIMGLGGSMLYNYGQSQYSEKQMKTRILRLLPRLIYNKQRYGRYVDILITHAPPRGIGDGEDLCHRGFECFLSFMEKYKPKYLLHGHVHLIDENTCREIKYCETTIINIYKNYILEDDSLGVRK